MNLLWKMIVKANPTDEPRTALSELIFPLRGMAVGYAVTKILGVTEIGSQTSIPDSSKGTKQSFGARIDCLDWWQSGELLMGVGEEYMNVRMLVG